MTTFTEGRHAAEFILSEANGQRSRENGTVLSGQTLEAGEVVQLNGAGKIVAFTALDDTSGDLITPAVGIMINAVDASAGDVAGSYIARDAEVNLNLLTYPEETTTGAEEAHTIASLAALGIIARS